MQGLWKVWLTLWCWGVFAFGVVLVTAAVPGADAVARFVYNALVTDPANLPLFDQPAVKFGLGVQGALTIGWALTMFAMMRVAETAGAPVWRALTTALLAWFAIDSTISVSTGFTLNAVSNTVLIVAYLIPVLACGVLTAQPRPPS